MTMIADEIDEEVALAQRRSAERRAATEAMSEACKGECKPPAELLSAAKLIARLRSERDDARGHSQRLSAASEQFAKALGADIASIMAGSPVPAESLLHGIAEAKQQAERDLTEYLATLVSSMAEAGLSAVPGLAGYYTPKGKLLSAIEAVSVSQFGDRISKEAFIRNRGWKWIGNGGWEDPGGLGAFSFDSAVTVQLRKDISPFDKLAHRDHWRPPPVAEKPEVKLVPMGTATEALNPSLEDVRKSGDAAIDEIADQFPNRPVAIPAPLAENEFAVPPLNGPAADEPEETDFPAPKPSAAVVAPGIPPNPGGPFDPNTPLPTAAFNIPIDIVRRVEIGRKSTTGIHGEK